jgi:hypothetical protein
MSISTAARRRGTTPPVAKPVDPAGPFGPADPLVPNPSGGIRP